MKWLKSYETYLFDTTNGDLGTNEYAEAPDNPEIYIARFAEKHIMDGVRENYNTVALPKTYDVSQMTERSVIGKAYYHEFLNDDGTILRESTTGDDYWNRAQIKAYPQPEPNQK